ncbi:Rieske 2Fe-2S domain-containing protein [Isoptericola sp. b441]|uniref:Cytochrome bc1 complex Rieske iron-sulfur subunit n=1 Tax=Actinotalea lenta TaxID=3064654 RepID=A0ABT9DAM5_9CELL|nr:MULTISPECIES: Rieske 2Fe-2S domain-containing protein [unclassified Isoptericola]MDO8107960.1 Rieske 2Fe-2S domain-containing protein [Isoptericola sp. b441]MDO8120373.1 Rieske 2Fe-2S domain-containing protein [Isoptericola sp. b490]
MSDESTEVGLPVEQHALPQRFENPGLPEHHPRLTDVDDGAAKRSERIVVVLFMLSALGTIGAIVAYFTVPPGATIASIRLSTMLIGFGLAATFIFAGAASVHWSKSLMNDHEKIEYRHPMVSDTETREQASEMLADGMSDTGLSRRGAIKGAMITAVALAPLGFAVPLIGSVGGDWDISKFRHTMWKKGLRLTHDPTGRPIKASDVTIGSAVHVIPEGLNKLEHPLDEKSKAMVLVIRLDPRDLHEAPDREGWSYEGIVAYSKVCTHVGCPVALYEQRTHHLLCPCHQSTFDISNGAKVIFGPADRPLPQLPITVDTEGYLVAQSDFHEPVGPSFWERLK